ncbi:MULTISPECIES: polysaccharide biosynthesis tyrosine autokinase [Paraburkholderia]|uniref:Polysaccharide biosynthesis tyrosine autokinase n=1 Tax=Paraburkholderia podalyriae TaxID=1938811 RepID=A0ABR7PM41_9BURK|nr:polysaccharide biosynthesis tyrosine autokinase [Paraburkholderia podalyriae]MBC8747442.1 polysaccharide biosynthesis tyrosine autokinase [Paraburkholderia podalyriae]
MNHNSPLANAAALRNDDVNLSRYLDVLVANRWLVGGIAGSVLALGVAYAYIARPVYQADILVQVEDSLPTNNSKSPLGDVSSMFDVKTEATAEMELLQSRMVVGKAVDDLGLDISAKPKRFPLIGDWVGRKATSLSQPGIFGYAGYAWGKESIKVSSFNVPEAFEGEKFVLTVLNGGRYRLEQSDLDQPIEGVVGGSLDMKLPDGAITLRVDSLNAKPGTEFVLVRQSREKTIEDLQNKLNISQKGKDSGIIAASLTGSDRLLTAGTLAEIGKAYVDQNLERKAAEAEKSLSFLSDLLPQLKSDLERAEGRYNDMRNRMGVFNLSEQGKSYLDQSVAAERSLLELKQKRAEMSALYAPDHPSIQAINQQIGMLTSKVETLSKQEQALPDLEQNAVRLTREVNVDNELYVGMLNNMQQLKLVRAGKVGTVRLVDSPVVPKDPIKPNKLLVIIYAALGGLILGVGTAFARAALYRGITDAEEIEERTGLNVYATVPLSQARVARIGKTPNPPAGDKFLLASEFPRDASIESLRRLRTALHFAMLESESGNNRVLLTGPTEQVGKSFLCANLAAVVSAAGKRVLLIDADFRRGHLEQYFGVDCKPGLADYLSSSDGESESIIMRDVVPGLDFVPRGATPENPAELLLSERMQQFLANTSEYDIVLIDTPPVLAVSDATALAHSCGTVLLVTRFETTSIAEVIEATKELKQANAHVKGVIFNGINTEMYRYSLGARAGLYRNASYLDGLPASGDTQKS